ncbi:phytolongin Phyl1.1-like [Phragmites australis]|uniref:phytolongin Phyl1.1-like n=1 Tax=Phragmites australis TaxID=29695 RepID=UPI002D77E0DE|nr:phytolongin Phyl1.1-like [Phragmites australis]
MEGIPTPAQPGQVVPRPSIPLITARSRLVFHLASHPPPTTPLPLPLKIPIRGTTAASCPAALVAEPFLAVLDPWSCRRSAGGVAAGCRAICCCVRCGFRGQTGASIVVVLIIELNWGKLLSATRVDPETLMNPRRSKSVKLLSARANKPLEVDIVEEDPRMSSSADNTVYCCIAKGRKVIYCYNSKDGDPQMDATAALCLENAPSYHRHYIHTIGSRSFGYLMADGHTFFAIIDPSVGNAGVLQFLERVREVFRNANRNGFHTSLVPAVQRLVASLEKMPRAAFVLEESAERGGSSESSSCTSSKVPLLGKSGSRKEKKSKDKAVSVGCDDEHHGTRGMRIDMPTEEVSGMSLERSSSQSRLRRQQPSRLLWMRHVKIIVVVDVIICLVLFAAWLAICKGFQCVSG